MLFVWLAAVPVVAGAASQTAGTLPGIQPSALPDSTGAPAESQSDSAALAMVLAPSPPFGSSSGPASSTRSLGLELLAGFEFEGMDQSFGLESWLDPGLSTGWPDDEQLETLRSRMRESELLGLASVLLRSANRESWGPRLQVDGRWGSRRKAISADGEAGWSSGALRGLSLRDRFQYDARSLEGESRVSRSGQNVLSFQWRPSLERGWRPVARGELDISWSDDEIAEGDTLGSLYAYFLDYRRVTGGIGLTNGGGSSASFDLVHKESRAGEGSDYDAGILRLLHAAYSAEGFRHIEVRCERRRSPSGPDSLASFSSALRSYWEAAFESLMQRRFGGFEWEGFLQVTGTRYDPAAGEDTLATGLGLDEDRFRIEGEGMIHRPLLGPGRVGEVVQSLSSVLESGGGHDLVGGIGVTGERLWLDGGMGEYASWGAKVEVEFQGGTSLGCSWIEACAEAGQRDYLGGPGSLVFDIGGMSYSFAQSDYRFLRLSLLAMGKLPFGLEWECYGFLEREDHEAGEHDTRLGSLHFALRRRCPVF